MCLWPQTSRHAALTSSERLYDWCAWSGYWQLPWLNDDLQRMLSGCRSIKSVVNYDTAKDIDTHVHRVGRTGRAGDKEGVAYTLVNANQVKAAGWWACCDFT
jgi:hypothetical protein